MASTGRIYGCGVALSDLTRQSVLDAIAEHDRVGADAFLTQHGFDSGEYFLLHQGQQYASKAIAGVAHGYATGAPLAAAAFSGGADTVQPALERLGFQVTRVPRRNPAWARNEVILAYDLVVNNGWRELRTHDPKVQELSELLRGMAIHPATERLENFRSPDAVSRKTTDLMTAHPDYHGARTRGGRVDREVIEEFRTNPAAMAAAAAALRQAATGGSFSRPRRSSVTEGLTREHIDAALREWWSLGREAFMAKHGGRSAERYVIVTDFGEVDALALVLGARSLAGLDSTGPWRGDAANVAQPLRSLGFRIDTAGRPVPPEVEAAERAVHGVACRPQRAASGSGQGFMVDQKSKLAVEAHAMQLARQHYAPLGAVVDTALRQSWDYEVDIGGDCWHIEVKGTTGDPVEVILTPNEVAHAKAYPFVALYMVSNINIEAGSDDERIASGGMVTLLHPWAIDDGELRPLGYCTSTVCPGRHSAKSFSMINVVVWQGVIANALVRSRACLWPPTSRLIGIASHQLERQRCATTELYEGEARNVS